MNVSALMQLAIEQAKMALQLEEVPVGCVIAHMSSGEIVGRGYNRRQTDHDPTAHAEVMALRQASQDLRSWRLPDCIAVVTLEPCPMCAGAMVNARIAKLVYGCPDPKAGAARTLFQLCDNPRLNHRMEIVAGVEADACAQLLRDFFSTQRQLGKK